MTEMGREKSGKDVFEWINEVQDLGGEILLTSVDKDGTLSNPDFELIQEASKLTRIPLIVSGGLTKTSDIGDVLKNNFVSGVALGGCLHYKKQSIKTLKKSLIDEQINIRETSVLTPNSVKIKPLKNITIGIINYGMGNQQSLVNTLEHLGANSFISNEIDRLNDADILALPGVGAFPKGMENLKELNLDTFIKKKVLEGLPLLGICLGMQMLFENSNEFEIKEGLNLIKGNVMRIRSSSIKLPHMGWNNLIPKNNPIYSLRNSSQYFVHSYAVYMQKRHQLFLNAI